MIPCRCLFTIAIIVVTTLLVACVSPPFDVKGLDMAYTPDVAVSSGGTGKRVLWGGVILETRNLASATRIEVIGYPLRKSQRPNTGAIPVGRFFVMAPGYLEAQDYAPGRELTVHGSVTESLTGRIGEQQYQYPVVSPEGMRIWRATDVAGTPAVQFGLGVSISK